MRLCAVTDSQSLYLVCFHHPCSDSGARRREMFKGLKFSPKDYGRVSMSHLIFYFLDF